MIEYKFVNDPTPFAFKAFQELYHGNVKIAIAYYSTGKDLLGYIEKKAEECYFICISDKIGMIRIIDVLCHELAHIKYKGHSKDWKLFYNTLFNRTQELYIEAMNKEVVL